MRSREFNRRNPVEGCFEFPKFQLVTWESSCRSLLE